MAALWKQQTSLHPAFDKLNRCLHDDWFLLPFELKLQRAHAKALAAAGILSAAEHTAIERGLGEIESQHDKTISPVSDAEDLHTWIETELIKRVGDAGKKIHTARSRNDQVATLLKMYVISCGERLANDLRSMTEVCCERASQWNELAFPLHTHQQFAAPGNVGFWILRFAVAWDRLRRRAEMSLQSWRQYCPLGSGAVAGSSIAIDRWIQAKELEFEEPSLNALDSTTTRDECLELLALGAQIGLHLQSFAADIIMFSQTSLAWTKYPAEFGTGSSMMPNKMNPDAMELLRGEANSLLASHGHALLLLKGLPSGYNRDLQCIKPLVRDAAEKLHSLCDMTRDFLMQLEFDRGKLAASLDQGSIEATLRMEQLVKDGKPLREAHHAVAVDVAEGRMAIQGVQAGWIEQYLTIGSASPAETRRIAKKLLAETKLSESTE